MPTMRRVLLPIAVVLLLVSPALAQDGSLLTNLENEVVAAARGWETTILQAARSLFWILAGIEIGIAAVWLALYVLHEADRARFGKLAPSHPRKDN